MGRGRGHQGLQLKCSLGESTDKGSDSYHICSLILLPSSSIVLILKSIPEKKKKERKGHISVSPISQAMSEEGAANNVQVTAAMVYGAPGWHWACGILESPQQI